MDREKTVKVRQAVRERMKEMADAAGFAKPTRGHLMDAVDELRELGDVDPKGAELYVGALSAQTDIREQMGPELWQLFLHVDALEWKRAQHTAAHHFRSEVDRYPDAASLQMFKDRIVSNAKQHVENAVRSNKHIRKAFSGKKNLLDEALRLAGEKLWPLFKKKLREAEQDDDY